MSQGTAKGCSIITTRANSLKSRGDLSLPGELKNAEILSSIFLLIPSLLTRDLGGSFANMTAACRNSCSSCEPSAFSLFLWNRLNSTSCHLYLHSSPMYPFFPVSPSVLSHTHCSNPFPSMRFLLKPLASH